MKTKYSLVRVRASRRHFIPAILASAFVCSLLAPKVQGADIYWDRGSSTNAWGTVGNWSTAAGAATPNPTAIPGTGDVAVLNITTLTSNQTLDLGADRSVGGISAVTAGTKLIQGGGANRTLTLGASGIAKSGTGAITIGSATANQNANVRLGADQTWTNSNNTGAITVVNSVAASSAANRKLTLSGTSTAGNIISALISNNGTGVFSIDKTGTGLWILANNSNSFTGNTVVSDGTLRLQNSNSLGSGTGNVLVTNTGSPTAGDNNNLQLSGGVTVNRNVVLENLGGQFARVSLESVSSVNGNNNTWSGNITFKGGNNQALTASSAPLTINGNLLMDASPSTGIFIRGNNASIPGTINGTITLGTASILKTDAGTWRINSTGNTHGNVTVANGALILGATNALDTTASITHGEGNGNNGRLEFQGVSQTIARWNTNVTSTGTTHIARNNDTTTASTLTFATPAATTDILKNVQIQGTSTSLGALHLVSNGAGRTEFESGLFAADSLTVNSGTIAFTGNASRNIAAVTGLSGAIIEKLGTGSLIVEGNWNNAGTTNVVGGMLALGAGTAGAVNVADTTTLSTGLGGGVLTTSAVTFGSAGATTYAPIITAPGVAPLTTGTLTNAGTTVTVAPLAASFSTGTYRLLDYTSATGLAGFTLAPLGSYPHITATLDTATSGQVNLVVTAVDSLIWTGQINNTWDVNTTSNFALASSSSTAATFYQGDSVAFGDTHDVGGAGTPVTNRTITGTALNAGSLSFTNTGTNYYSVAVPLTVAGNITKSGDAAVTLSGSNLINGTVSVTDGTLKIGSANALAGNAGVTVSGSGTIDANGITPGTRYDSLTVSGTGVGGNGAVVNNGAALINLNHFNAITLAGDTTWGGSARYDVSQNMTFNGGSNTLTKTGAGDFWYSPAVGHTIGNIIVNQGTFGLQFRSNILDVTSTVTVNNSGFHTLWGVNSQHPVTVNDGGTFQGGTGTSISNGIITLSGTGFDKNLGGAGTLNTAEKITGDGGFTKVGAGAMNILSAANDFTGDVRVLEGALNMSPTGVIPATVNLTVDGGTFDTWNRNHTVASISGSGGRIHTGTAAISRLTTTQSTSTVANVHLSNVVIEMSGTGSLTLGGTVDNNSGAAIVNSGTLVLAKGNTTPVGQAIHAIATGNLTINGGTVQLAGTYDNTTAATGINAPPAGINTSTYGDLIYNNVAINLNAGTLDMNGRQEAVNQLLNPTGVGGTITNTSATASKLYIGHQNGASTFAGAINDGTGTIAIEKIGTGALTLSGTSNFTGGLTQTAGTIIVPATGVLGNTPITITANTFTLDGTHGTGAIALNGTSTFAGAGTSTGLLTAASGTTIQVGTASGGTAAATLTLGGLNLSGGANLNLDFNSAGTTVDKVATTVSNGATLSGSNNLNVVLSGAGWVTGTYPILTYSGALGGTGAGALTLTTPVGHSTVTVVDDTFGTVNLVVSSTANKWVGGVNSVWDTDTTLNWSSGDQKFLAGDTVVFDDTATTFTPNIAANQTAAGVTFDNSADYTLSSTGSFGIAGTGGLIKTNSGTVTISSANTYTGTTDVQQGTLIANYNTGTAQTVFAAASAINVASGATFKAVANDSNFTLANNLTGTGLVVIDPHLTAGAAVRDVTISGNNAGFTGTLRLSPTVIGDGSGTFRTNQISAANASGATIDVDAGGQAWLGAVTFPNNFILSGHGYAEVSGGAPAAASGLTQYSGAVKGGIGAIRMNNGTDISGNVTLDGSAKIMAYGATGTISGSINITNSSDLLVVGGGASNSNLNLTGTNNMGANALKDVFVNAGGTAGTNVLQIGNLGTTGTLGTGNVTLYTDAAGAQLRMQRSDGYTMAQNVTAMHNGTASNLTKASFVANSQGAGVSLNGFTIDLTDGTNTAANAGGVYVAGAGGAAGVNNAVLNIDGSSIVKAGQFFIGDAAGFSGTVNQSGTSDVQVASHVRVSHYGTNTSAYNISSGTLTIANVNTGTDPSGGGEQIGGIYLGVDGTGTMTQSGGTVTTDWIVLDNRVDTVAGTNMPDGIDRYTLSGSGLLVLRSQWGITQRNTSTAVALSGGTIRNAGTNLQVRLDIAPDVASAVTLDNVSAGNSFNLMRSATGLGSLVMTGGGTLKLTTATTQSIDVPVSGAAALEKLGAGVTTLTKANTYDGTTTISAGTLKIGVADAIPSGTGNGDVVFSVAGTNSVLDLNGFDTSINGLSQNSISTANMVVNNATGTNKTLTVGNNDVTTTYGGVIADNTSGTGTVALTKTGSGTLNLTGTSTFTGPITVNEGMLTFTTSPATNGSLGNSTAINLNDGGISYTTAVSNNALNRSVAIGAGDGTIDVASVAGGLTMVGANVTSTGGDLIKTGLGAVSISGTTTLNGGAAGVEVTNGKLQAGFGASGVNKITVGATGNLSMQNSAIESLTLGNTAGALTLNGGARLGFEFDGATNDEITVGATGTPSLTAGVVTLDLFDFGAGITAGSTYTLLSTTLGDLTSGGLTSYVIGTAPSGFNYSLNVTSTSVTLSVVAFSPAYWTNSQGTGSWSTLNAGPLSNFNTLATGGVNTAALPGVNETVYFNEDSVTGVATSTLDGNFTVYGVNFVAGSGSVTAVNINQGSSGTLTIQPSTGLGGIDVGANAGVVTIGAPLVASNTDSPSQTWNVVGTGANGSSLTLNGAVAFNANVIKSGAGTLTLGNASNTGAGNFALEAGTLALNATGNMPTGVMTIGGGTTINNVGAGSITLAHSAYTWNGSFTQLGQNLNLGTGAVTLAANVVTTIPANTLTVGGDIDDGASTFGLTKSDAGILVLNGNNGYDGITTMNLGTLTLAGDNSGAGGGVTLNAGLLNINSNNALGAGRLTLNGGTIDNTSAGSVTQAGNPAQTWTNAVNMAFTGTQPLNLGAGAVTLGTDATTGSFTLTNNSALSGTSLTVGGDISAVLGGTAGVKTLDIAGVGSTALTGSISRGSASALDINVNSGGTTTLSGAASSIRTINLNGGASSILDLGAGNLTLSNGGANGFVASAGGTINATGGGKITLGSDLLDNGTANGTLLTVNAEITGPFTFEIYGGSATNTGVTVLTAQNTYTGRTDINGGNLSVSNIGNSGSTTSNLGSGSLIQSGAAVLAGSTVTTGKLIYTGAGETTNRTLSLNGAGFAIEQAATSGNLVFSANVAVPSNTAKTLYLLGSTAGTGEISGVISNNTNATSINKLGTGAWTLSGVNTYSGATTVTEGTLTLSGARTAASGGMNVSTTAGLSATLNITNGSYAFGANAMNIGNAATTAATGTVNQSGGAISFTSGNAVLVGQGTVGNQGVYNMSGGSITTFASTTRGIMLGVNSNLAPGPSSGGGTFNLSGTGVLNMTAASGGGGNALLQIGRSDTAANNTTNAFNQTGGTANVGILTMGGTAAGSTGVSATLNLTGGTFSANSFTLMSAGGTNTSVINIGGSAAVTLPAFPTNAKGASSTATITFDSTTGSLSPLAGSATYMSAGTFNNAYLTANGAKFNVGTGNDITIGQVLEDAVSPAAAGTLTKSGLGTLTLTAANSYTGATSVSAGTLALVGGSQASPITVSAGASLSFTLGSPTTSTSSFDVTAGTIKITGTPTLPSYTLITSSTGITGTPTLDAPIAGYSLVKVGNSLVLTSPQGLYDAWVTATGGAGGKTANPDSDSLNNLLEYAFGTDPLAVTGDLAYSGGSLTTPGKPILEEVGGVWYAVFTRRKDHVDAGLTYSVEFSSDLSPWTASAVGATVVASDSLLEVVRVPFPNLVSSDSGPQKPRFFQVKVTSSF